MYISGMRVTAKKCANVVRSRQNGQLCERRSQTLATKPDKALNQGMDHFGSRPTSIFFCFLHVSYLLAVSADIAIHRCFQMQRIGSSALQGPVRERIPAVAETPRLQTALL